ncbi:MAG TPA: hypothetical protein VK138_02460 [Acidiferrobacterales bacterium]|nr:hypothetical protein [Acidiferrobacterales bacterium]
MDRIERELREQQKQIWIQRIRESKFAIVFALVIVIILSWNIYRSTDRVIENEKLFGVLAGIHQVQGNLGSSTTMLSIKLNNGENVMVTAPANFVVRIHAEVEIIRGKTEQGSVYYYFSRLVGE